MALVYRPSAAGRGAVATAHTAPDTIRAGAPEPPVPAQAGASTRGDAGASARHPGDVGAARARPVDPVAAAVPTPPAAPWSLLAGAALVAGGAVAAVAISHATPAPVFRVNNDISAFAALFVFAAAVERLLEPVSRWMPGHKAQSRYEQSMADLANGVPGAVNTVARDKAAMGRARASRAMLMWGLATAVSTAFAAAGGFYLLRMIAASPDWNALSPWLDALVTGLVVGSGTKPLHDLISRVQKQKEKETTAQP